MLQTSGTAILRAAQVAGEVMQAVCITEDGKPTVCDIPKPEIPPPGHVLVDLDAAAVTHGDKFFLTRPLPGAAGVAFGGRHVYGANGGGRIVAIGAGVPNRYAGRQVAIYKSLARTTDTIGVWCERVQVSYETCLILPETVSPRDLCGSFANILTVYAFVADIVEAGHKAMIVTAGNSATGRMAIPLACRRNVPVIFLVRTSSARDDLIAHGAEHVVVTTEEHFETRLGALAEELGATAVFDGVGGALLSRILSVLPVRTTIYVYGFLGGPTAISVPTTILLGKDLTLRRFSNFESATVREPQRLAAAVNEIEDMVDGPLFRTRIGKTFALEQVEDALAFEAASGERAILVP